MECSATLSHCRRYRYALWRRWAPGPQALFIMLNPSTADETNNDPTIRRCIGFARSWGYAALAVGNLFAFRTPSPLELRAATDPIGTDADAWLLRLHKESALTVAAWGNHGRYLRRGADVRKLLLDLQTLGFTKAGQPKHPLYVPGDAPLILWE